MIKNFVENNLNIFIQHRLAQCLKKLFVMNNFFTHSFLVVDGDAKTQYLTFKCLKAYDFRV